VLKRRRLQYQAGVWIKYYLVTGSLAMETQGVLWGRTTPGGGMGHLRSQHPTFRIFCALPSLCALIAWSLPLIAAPTATVGDVPHSAAFMTDQPAVPRLIVRFRPHVHPA